MHLCFKSGKLILSARVSVNTFPVAHIRSNNPNSATMVPYGKPVIRRVIKSSPCANHRAHGEESLCRGPNTEHTAKIKHTAKGGFTVCSNLSTRRNDFFAVCQRPAHGKDSATWPDIHGWSTPSYFAVCHMEAHRKHSATWPDVNSRSTPSYFAVRPR